MSKLDRHARVLLPRTTADKYGQMTRNHHWPLRRSDGKTWAEAKEESSVPLD